MSRNNEHYLYLVSDGCLEKYSGNTINNFTNDIHPHHLRPDTASFSKFPLSSKWEVAVSELSFHVDFGNVYSHPFRNTFSLALVPKTMFEKYPKGSFHHNDFIANMKAEWMYSVPPRCITLYELLHGINEFFEKINPGMKVTVDKEKRICFHSQEKNDQVLLVENQFKQFLFTEESVKSTMEAHDGWAINVYTASTRYFVFAFPVTGWSKYPESLVFCLQLPPTEYEYLPQVNVSLVDILSPQIENSQPCENQPNNLLCRVGLNPIKENSGYQHFEFVTPTFFPTNNTYQDLKTFTINISHNGDETITASSKHKHSTYCKLILRKPYVGMSNLPTPVHIVSKPTTLNPQNKKSSFTIRLPHSKSIPEGDYRVALVDIAFPLAVNMPITFADRAIIFYIYDTSRQSQTIETIRYIGYLPEFTKDLQDIANQIHTVSHGYCHTNIIGEKGNERLKLSCKESPLAEAIPVHKIEFVCSKVLFQFLNGTLQSTECQGVREAEVISLKPNESFEFANTPDFARFLPKNLFVYTDLVKPSPLGGNLIQLLKVIPISNKRLSERGYQYIQFQNLEFHEVAARRIDDFSVRIKDSKGDYIDFTEFLVNPSSSSMTTKNSTRKTAVGNNKYETQFVSMSHTKNPKPNEPVAITLIFEPIVV